MNKHVYYRMAGNGSMLALLTINSLSAPWYMEKYLPTHPELKIFDSLSFRYATTWNMTIQMLYTILALICDYYTVQNQEGKISPAIRQFRCKVFYEIVFPNCISIAPFWPIYFFDRELIFPLITEIVMSKWQNVVVHGLIFAYVSWELVFLPDDVPKRSEVKITPIISLQTAYMINVIYTKFVHPGAWVYGILDCIEGCIWFYIVFFLPMICSIIGFYTQWTVKDYLSQFRDYKLKFQY